MSVRTDTVNLNVNINGNKAQADLNNLRKKAGDIALEMQGLKKGTAEYIAKAKELRAVNAEMDGLKKQIGITALNQKELVAELRKLNALKGSVQPFTKEFKDLQVQIDKVNSRLYDVRNGVTGLASFFSKIKDEVKQFGVVAAGYLGFQFITSQFQNIIRGAGKLSDQLADLRRIAGLTGNEAENLNNRFKQLDTRTSTEGLREIAIIAGKLGVAKDDIFEFTKAVDQLVVSLGAELGNADQITETLGKILNVFDGKVTGDNITRLGNAFVELANSGVASAGFIADFDQRLSGIAKSANIGLGQLSGLGAGLEELGARTESSATAVQKLIISIAGDLPKAAKIAGMSTKDFNDLFSKNATEALLRYSEGLVKNKASFSEVTASLKDAGEEGARTVETISKLGTNADMLRKRIDLGAQSIKESAAITDAFALKNETFGATLDKLGKEFNKLVTAPAVTNFLKSGVEGAMSFIKAIRQIPSFLEQNRIALLTLAAGLMFLNKQYVYSALATINDTIAKKVNVLTTRLGAVATQLAITAQAAYITVTNLLTGRITLATAAQRLWNIATNAGKVSLLGIILTAGALISILSSLLYRQKELTAAQRASAEVATRITEITADEEAKAKSIFNSLKLGNLEYSEKVKLLNELKAISPGYLNALTLENIKTQEGLDILNNYLNKLRETNRVKARNEVILQKEKRITVLETEQKNLSQKGDIKGSFLSDIGAQVGIGKGSSGYQYFQNAAELANLKDELKVLYTEVGTSIVQNVNQTSQGNATLSGNAVKTLATLKDELKTLDEAYQNIDINNKKALASNRLAAKALEDQINALEGKKSPGQKKGESEFARLKKEAEKFYKEIQQLKKRAEIKGESPEQAEIDAAINKYNELLAKAKEYYGKHAIDQKRFNEEEKLIEEAKQQELLNIFNKYLKKRQQADEERKYENALEKRREYSSELKVQASKDYADGIITKKQYEAELKTIERNETKDRYLIANLYAANVKKAQKDLRDFRKTLEQQTTADIIDENNKRAEDTAKDRISKAKRKVLTTRPDTQARLEAQRELLRIEYEQEIANADLTHEELLTREAEYQQANKDLNKSFLEAKISQLQQYANAFQSALNSLNTFINNKEQQQFNREKALNDKKRKDLKKQLDSKLISQAQYDKKMNELQETQDAKERELKRKQAKREKALNIFRAVVNVAAGVASSLSYGGPVGIALAAITAVLGALEIAAIASQPLPELGRGQWVRNGDKHSDPSGGINAKIERGEAVMSAAAMEDPKTYTITGTGAQITSALNSQAGGVNWAGGAIVRDMKFITDKPSQINPNLPRIMEQGGIVRPISSAAGAAAGNGETNALLAQLIEETKANTEEIKTMKTRIKGEWVYKEFQEVAQKFEDIKTLSGISQKKTG